MGGDVNDPIYVNPAFVTWFDTQSPALGTTNGFDSTEDHRSIPFTIRYDLAPGETIVHAWVSMRVKRVVAYSTDSSHLIQIGGVGQNNADFSDTVTYYWQCGGVTPPCTAIPADMAGPLSWSFGSTPVVRVLDLGPHLHLLNQTQTVNGRRVGELNMNFHRRTRVDWASLTLVIQS